MNFGIIEGSLIVSSSLNTADRSLCNENDLTSNRWEKKTFNSVLLDEI